MTDSEILECSQAIYDFLITDDSEFKNLCESFSEMPHFKKMQDTLLKYKTDMVSFTLFLNRKYNIYAEPLGKISAREFFFSTKSHDFYRITLRELKIKICLN